MSVTVLDSLVASVHLAALRDQSTPSAAFARHAHVLGMLLADEATRALPTQDVAVTTPLAAARGLAPAVDVVLVPVLRAGLGLLSGAREALPDATVGLVGLERDETTLVPSSYYQKLPPLDDAWALVLEPMLATGGSGVAAVERLHDAGAATVIVLSVVATDAGLQQVDMAGADIVTAAVDPELDDQGWIVPGLGDFGDRLMGT